MATIESTQLRDISSLTFAAKTKIQTTIRALELQLQMPDLEQAFPTVRGLMESLDYFIEDLANDIDTACEDHAAEPV